MSGLSLLAAFCLTAVAFVAVGQSVKVRVVVNRDNNSAVVHKLGSTANISEPPSCLDPKELERYPAIPESWPRESACADGLVKSAIFLAKIADVEISISEIDKRVASLNRTKTYMTSFSAVKMNGVSLVAIPRGSDEPKNYENVSSVAMKCLNDSSNGIVNSIVPIGNLANDAGSVFNVMPSITSQKIEESRANLTELARKLGSKTDLSMNGTLDTVPFLLANQKIAAEHFIPITYDDLQTNYKSLALNKFYLSSSFNWVLNNKGLRDERKVNWAVKTAAKILPSMKDVPIPDALTHFRVSFENISFDAWLEERMLYKSIIASIDLNLQRYRTLKSGHQTRLKQYQNLHKLIVDGGYGCN